MLQHLIRRPAVAAVVLVVGAAGITVASPAHAALPSTGGRLTIADGSTTVHGPVSLTTSYPIDQIAWSPDGSRGVFVTDDGYVATVRWNDGENVYPILDPDTDPTAQRTDVQWVGNGDRVIWAEKTAGKPSRIEQSVSSFGYQPVRVTPDDGMHYLNPDTNLSFRLVVQRQADSGGAPTGTPEIGIINFGNFQQITTDASNPSISPDGTRVAFVRSDGTHRQIWVSNLSGGDLVQVTSNPVDHDNPTWSPSGQVIAFSQGDTVAEVTASGSTADTPTVTAKAGRPAYQPLRRDRVVRLSGTDRHTTAVKISQSLWRGVGTIGGQQAEAKSVVLSRSDVFADGLGGAALAVAKQGPLLLTPPTSLDPNAKAEIQRILPPGGTVYLLGSTGALSQSVQDQIRALGYQTVRLAGADRFGTSIAVANAIDTTPDVVLTATGMDYPDALAAGAATGGVRADGKTAVLVLTNNATLAPATKTYLDALPAGTEMYGIGLYAAQASAAYGSVPVVGDSRYETAALTAWAFFGGENHVGIATGSDWPDALAGGALMGSLGGPLMLTPGTSTQLSPEASEVLDEFSGSVHTGLIFGSEPVVWAEQQSAAGALLSGPAGYLSENNTPAVRTGTPAGARTAATGPGRSTAEIKAAVVAGQKRLSR
ncbi:cell wall-binding repeat-containing protein [Micromonospora sp. NPDC049274]|uniref:cell wall-binding repeat-containing protein n=1 Tax=Micromonospora sp. NPDC049274 TaxID=3154829 RepID=UPI00341FEED8